MPKFMTRRKVAEKYGIDPATLWRYFKRNPRLQSLIGFRRLSPAQVAIIIEELGEWD